MYEALHGDSLEIVSPTFMNSRQIQDKNYSYRLRRRNTYEAEIQIITRKTTEQINFERASSRNMDKIKKYDGTNS
jgi:hypothetical protein